MGVGQLARFARRGHRKSRDITQGDHGVAQGPAGPWDPGPAGFFPYLDAGTLTSGSVVGAHTAVVSVEQDRQPLQHKCDDCMGLHGVILLSSPRHELPQAVAPATMTGSMAGRSRLDGIL